MTETKELVVLRGPSGSGKSTYTRTHYPHAFVCSADDEFLDASGKYVFDVSKLSEAHLACWRKCHEALMRGEKCVVVDNTNTQLWEMSPYVQMGRAMGYSVLIVRMDTPVEVAASRNVHGVPASKVRAMYDRFQKINLPGWHEIVVKGV